MDRLGVESIAQLSDADVRLLANYGEGGDDGACEPCAPGQLANKHLAAPGAAASGMPEVRRGRAVESSDSSVLGTKTRKTGQKGLGTAEAGDLP